MASDLRIQGEVVVNSEQAESAFNRVGDKAQQMATEVATSATKAGQAVDKIGDGAGASAEKFTRAESRISASIKRATNELELLGKTASQRLEFNIADKGLDPKKFEPMLQRLREVEQRAREAERAATGSLDNMGMSAKATAAAMRGVPAQFQDIIVSLQGGQAPMTVLLQQGSQLSGMFGGVGNAAKALGTYIVGLVNPLTIAAAAVAGLGFAMYSLNGKDAALRDLSAQLIGTGRASAAAVGDIKALVNELNTVPGVSKAAATAIIGEFAKVGGLGSSLFKGLGSSVADFAAATGTDLPTAAKKLAEAFADPAKGAKTLEDSLGTLTAAQILTITKMAEMGDKSGAQVAMMAALKQAVEGLANDAMTPLGRSSERLSNAWDVLMTSMGDSGGIRAVNDMFAGMIDKIARITTGLAQMRMPPWLEEMFKGGLNGMVYRGLKGSDGGATGSWGPPVAQTGATGSWGTPAGTAPPQSDLDGQVKAALELTRSYESQSAAMEKLRGIAKVAKDALKELEAQNRGNSVEAKELRERIAGVNEKLAEMAKKGGATPKGGDPFAADREAAKQWSSYVEKFTKAAADATAKSEGLSKSQATLVEFLQSPAYQNASEPMREVALQGAYAAIAQEQLNEATKQAAQIAKDAAKGHAQYVAELSKGANAAQQQADQLRTEEAAAAIAAGGYYSLAQAIELVTIKRLEEQQKGLLGNEDAYLAVQKEIDARKELVGLIGAKEARKAAEDSAKDAAREWDRAAADINRSLTDALLRGFESGKDFAKNMRDTVVNMFKTLVLRPIISAVVNPVAGAVTNALGLGGGQSGGGGIAGGIQTASNLNSLYGAGSQALFGGAAGASAASLGYANAVGMVGGDAIGALAAANGMWAGVATGAQAAAQAAIAANTAMAAGEGVALAAGTNAAAAGAGAASAGGLSGALAAIPGWGWALAGVGALAAIFGKDDSGTYHTGGAGSYSAAGGANTGAKVLDQGLTFGVRYSDYNSQAESAAVGISQSIVGMLDATAKSFGNQAGYFAATAFADDSSKDGAWGSLIIKRLDDTVTNWADTQTSKWAPKVFSDGEAGQKEYAAALAMSVRDALVGAVEGVDWAQSLLTGLGDAPTLEGLQGVVATINAAQAAFDALGKNIVGFGALTDGAISQLIKAAGSIDGLVSAASTYYENFYTDAEKTANVTRDVAAALADVGLQMPTTREEFRALVDSQLALGESGATAVAALFGLSGAFASVTAASETAAEAAARLADEQGKAAEAAARAAEDAARRAEEIARERYGLETQIMQLLGDTAGLRMREIEALDASNRALQEHIYAIEDARAAYDKSIASAQSAYGVLESSVGTDRSALQSALDAERDAISARYKLQQDGHAAQLSAAQSAADKMRGIAYMLSGALRNMKVESPALDRARLQSARGVIGAAAASSNVMAPGLEAALSVVAGDVRKMYGRWEDFAFDQGVTAGQTAALSSAAQSQLSGYESIVSALKSQDDVTKLLADAEMAAAQERFDIESKKLDERLEQGKSMLDRLLGIEEGTLSSVEALARLTDAVNASNAALQAQKAAEAAAQMAAMQGGGGGGGGTPYKGPTYTDFMGNQVALQAGQSKQFYEAVAAAGTAAVGSLSELRDRLQAVGKSDIWDALSKDLTLSYQDVDKTGGRGVPIISASDGVILVAGYRPDNESMQDYATKISGWAQNNGVQGSTNNGYSQSDISNAISTTLGQGASVGDILNAGASNFGLTEQEIRDAARAAGIPGFATGINRVPHDMLARIHKDEAVVPAAYNPYNPGASAPGNSEVVAELRKLNERMARIEASSNATAGHTAGTDRKLARVIQNDAIKTETTV